MNRSTKKIKKLKRPTQLNANNQKDVDDVQLDRIAQLLDSEADLEKVTSGLANLHSEIEETQFFKSINGEILLKLVTSLNHNNPQIIINSLYALQNLIRIASDFSEPHRLEQMLLAMGFIDKLDSLQQIVCNQISQQSQSVLLPALISLKTEFFETCEQKVLNNFEQSQYMISTLNLIVTVLNKLVSEDALLALFNFLQVISESMPKMNQLFLHSSQSFLGMFKSIFQGQVDHPIWESISQHGKLKIRSLMIIILFNIIEASNQDVSDFILIFNQSVGQLIMNSLTVAIFKEIQNFDIEEQKQQQSENDIEEEKEVTKTETTELDQKIKNSLNIWFQTADSIIEQLKFLARIYEIEEEDDQMESDNQKRFPDFFTQQFGFQILKLIQTNFLGLQDIICAEKFLEKIQGLSFTNQIAETSTFIIRSAIGAVQNMVYYFIQKRSIFFSLKDLVEFGIVQMNEISSRYKQGVIFENEESCDDLLHCYTRLLLVAFSGQKDLVQTIDPGVILNILVALNGKNQELILSGVELAKEKFNSSIRNSIEDVRKVTDFLLQLMNGDNLLVSASALDCFFDVYTEEDYNQILVERNLLSTLEKGLQYWSSIIGGKKKKVRKSEFEFIDMTLGNLQQFIEYKRGVLKM